MEIRERGERREEGRGGENEMNREQSLNMFSFRYLALTRPLLPQRADDLVHLWTRRASNKRLEWQEVI